jgi:transposase
MDTIPQKSRQWRRQLVRWSKRAGDSAMVLRAQIAGMLASGNTVAKVAEIFDCARSHIYRTAERFNRDGRNGLFDDRRNNGTCLLDKNFHETVKQLISQTPQRVFTCYRL